MSKREAAIAVLVAFAVGVIAAGSLRDRAENRSIQQDPSQTLSGEVTEYANYGNRGNGPGADILRWRVTSAFGTHLPTLGENPVQVAERLRIASGGACTHFT